MGFEHEFNIKFMVTRSAE